MPKTIVIRDSSISELVLGDKHIHNYTAGKEAPQPKQEREVEDVPFEEVDTHFSHITELCRQKNMVDHVENTLRAACCGSPKNYGNVSTTLSLWDIWILPVCLPNNFIATSALFLDN